MAGDANGDGTGSTSQDQSIVRSPEGTGDSFIQHLSLENAGEARYSPGYFINPIIALDPDDNNFSDPGTQAGQGEDNASPGDNTVAPEPATIFYLAFGLGPMLLARKR